MQDLVVSPRSSHDLKIKTLLRIDGKSLTQDEINRTLGFIIPEDVSRFYLFDGELLQEYERLLIEDDSQGTKIKDAIESVLGVPALINGRRELDHLKNEAQIKQAKDLKAIKNTEQKASLFIKLNDELKVLKDEKTELERRKDGYEHKVSEIEDQLSELKEEEMLLAREESLKNQLLNLESRESDLIDEKLRVIAVAWKDVIHPKLEVRRKELRTIIEGASQNQFDRGSLQQKIDSINYLLTNAVCPTCYQELSIDTISRLNTDILEIKKRLDEKKVNSDKSFKASVELKALNLINPENALNKLRRISGEEEELKIEICDVESQIEKIKAVIRRDDSSIISRLHKEKENLFLQIGSANSSINRIRSDIKLKNDEINSISRLLSGSNSSKNLKSTRDLDCYSDLERVFSRSIDILRDKLRKVIQKEASAIFKKLTTENQYKGLQINDNYGLTIIDKDDQPVSIRSAGAEQIVAYSFICALNNTANKPAPALCVTKSWTVLLAYFGFDFVLSEKTLLSSLHFHSVTTTSSSSRLSACSLSISGGFISSGLFIHTASGQFFAQGTFPRKRSGWLSKAASNT